MAETQHKMLDVVHNNCMTRQDTHNIPNTINLRYEPEDDGKTNVQKQSNMAIHLEVEFEGKEEPRQSSSTTHLQLCGSSPVSRVVC